MKTRLQLRLVWLGTSVLACSIIAISVQPSYGQGKRTFRRAQFEQSIPDVDVPTPTLEGEPFLPANNAGPPSLDGSSTRITPDLMDAAPMPEPMMDTPLAPDGFQEEIPYDAGVPPLDEQTMLDAYPMDEPFYEGAFDEGPAPIYSTGTWFRRGQWYSAFEFAYLTREMPRTHFSNGIPGLAGAPGTRPVKADDILKHDFQLGTRLTLGRFLGRDAASRDHLLEFEFLGLFHWDNNHVLRAEDGASITTNLNGISGGVLWDALNVSDVQTFGYESDYNKATLDYKISSRPSRDQLAMQPDGRWVRHAAASRMPTLVAGLRYVQLDDGFLNRGTRAGDLTRVETTNGVPGGDLIPDMTTSSDTANNSTYSVRTNNDMFGIHLGAETVEKYDEWSWGLKGRIGGLANFAQRRSRLVGTASDGTETQVSSDMVQRTDEDGNDLFLDSDGNVTLDDMQVDPNDPNSMIPTDPLLDTIDTFQINYESESQFSNSMDNQLVFVAEVDLFGTYQLRPNLHLKASYQLTYYHGLSLALENLVYINGFENNNLNGSLFLHGGIVGLETTW